MSLEAVVGVYLCHWRQWLWCVYVIVLKPVFGVRLCYITEASGWGVSVLQYWSQWLGCVCVIVLEPVVGVCLCYSTGASGWGVSVL